MRCNEPEDFFPNYIRTYIDRDVRAELGVRKISSFNTFLTLCATRIGEVLNIESLADDCDISVDTARSWLSVLESSFIAFRLHPYHKNFGKRRIKAPKLYFYDTGLAANLLGIETVEQLADSQYRGNLYENAVAVEIIKRFRKPRRSGADHRYGHGPPIRRLRRRRILPHATWNGIGFQQPWRFDRMT